MYRTYSEALSEYFHAYRFWPSEPLLLLSIAVAYLNLASTKKVPDRNRAVLNGFAFMQVGVGGGVGGGEQWVRAAPSHAGVCVCGGGGVGGASGAWRLCIHAGGGVGWVKGVLRVARRGGVRTVRNSTAFIGRVLGGGGEGQG